MTTNLKPTESTLKVLIQEVRDQAQAFEKAARAFESAQPGSPEYDGAAADLAVEADWLKMKAQAVSDTLDEMDEHD